MARPRTVRGCGIRACRAHAALPQPCDSPTEPRWNTTPSSPLAARSADRQRFIGGSIRRAGFRGEPAGCGSGPGPCHRPPERQRHGARTRPRYPHHPAGRAARASAPQRHQEGLRPRPVRRLHGACGRPPRGVVPEPGGDAPGCRGDHDRRPGHAGRAAPAADRLSAARRLPVRLLHTRADLLGGRSCAAARPATPPPTSWPSPCCRPRNCASA